MGHGERHLGLESGEAAVSSWWPSREPEPFLWAGALAYTLLASAGIHILACFFLLSAGPYTCPLARPDMGYAEGVGIGKPSESLAFC